MVKYAQDNKLSKVLPFLVVLFLLGLLPNVFAEGDLSDSGSVHERWTLEHDRPDYMERDYPRSIAIQASHMTNLYDNILGLNNGLCRGLDVSSVNRPRLVELSNEISGRGPGAGPSTIKSDHVLALHQAIEAIYNDEDNRGKITPIAGSTIWLGGDDPRAAGAGNAIRRKHLVDVWDALVDIQRVCNEDGDDCNGNGVCDGAEDATNCPRDCGVDCTQPAGGFTWVEGTRTCSSAAPAPGTSVAPWDSINLVDNSTDASDHYTGQAVATCTGAGSFDVEGTCGSSGVTCVTYWGHRERGTGKNRCAFITVPEYRGPSCGDLLQVSRNANQSECDRNIRNTLRTRGYPLVSYEYFPAGAAATGYGCSDGDDTIYKITACTGGCGDGVCAVDEDISTGSNPCFADCFYIDINIGDIM